MNIKGINVTTYAVNHRETWVFVQIDTDEGIQGLGELNPSAPRGACLAALRQLEQLLIGEDPCQIAHLTEMVNMTAMDRPGIHAFSAIEQGLWDILGKSLGVPVYTLLGGRCRDEIRVYANITRNTFELTPEAFSESASAAVADGFDTLKIAPFSGHGLSPVDDFRTAENGLRCVHAVRDAVGPDVGLMVDLYGMYTADCALKIAYALDGTDLFWLEEPVRDGDIEGYARVKAECQFTVAGGERMQLLKGYRDVLEHPMMDVIMPDVTIVGGIGALKQCASAAEACGMQTAPHGPFGPITVASGIQAMASHPGFLILEYPWGLTPQRPDLTVPPERIENSRIAVPDGPGLGVVLNEELIRTG